MKSCVASHRVGIVFGPSSTASVNPYLTPLQGSNRARQLRSDDRTRPLPASSLHIYTCPVILQHSLEDIVEDTLQDTGRQEADHPETHCWCM